MLHLGGLHTIYEQHVRRCMQQACSQAPDRLAAAGALAKQAILKAMRARRKVLQLPPPSSALSSFSRVSYRKPCVWSCCCPSVLCGF
jgi:hypothetical protein